MPMKKRVMAVILVSLLVVIGYFGYQHYTAQEDEGLMASGTIEATKVELSAKLAGTLGNLNIESGSTVQKGQVVGVIERNDLAAQKERDALGVHKAEAQLQDLTSGARAQEIKEASANVSMYEASWKKSQADWQRGQQLFQEGAIPKDQLEKLETDLQMKQGQLEAAQARLSLLQAGNRPETIKAAQVEVDRSKAVLKAAEVLLADTKIISPLTGIVLSKNREPGEFVQAGASMATVVDLKDMWIRIYVPTEDLPQIKLNQRVSFTVSGSDEDYTGIIEEIASQGEYTPKTIQTKKERTNIVYAVKIRISNQDGTLKPGMPADVKFRDGTQQNLAK